MLGVNRHFANPEESWDEAASINKDGTQLIIDKLTIAAENINNASNEKTVDDLNEISLAIVSELLKYFHSNDKDEELQKAKSIAGDITEVNGAKLVLPRGVDEDDFEDFIDDLQPETLEALGGMRLPWDIDDVRDAVFKSEGEGRYSIYIGSAPEARKDGQKFILEYTPELAQKNAELASQRRRPSRGSR